MSPLTELCCKRTVEIIQTHLVYALNGRMHNGELSSSFTLLLFVALLQSKLLYIFPCVTLGWSRFLLCDSSFRVPFYLSFQRSKAMSAPSLRWFVCSFEFFSRLGVFVLSIPNDRALKEASGSALLLCNVHMSGAVMENRICLSTLHSRIVLFLIASNCNCD